MQLDGDTYPMALDELFNELGIDAQSESTQTDESANNTQPDNTQDFVQDSDNPTDNDGESKTEENVDTEQQTSELEAFKQQIEKLEKRLSDKDAYINELREQSKKVQESNSESVEVSEDETFWDDPEKTIQNLQRQIQMQDLRLNEVTYANTKKDYWEVVTGEEVKKALASDETFAKDFSTSSKPYEVAYEYLSTQKQNSLSNQEKLKAQLREEILKELNINPNKEKKETVPSLSKMGGSKDSKNDAPVDGFTAMFGNDGYN